MTTPITPDQIRKAKEWAEYVTRPAHMWSITPAAHAAAEVIQSLPDEIVDGDKLRDIIKSWSISEVNQANSREMFREIKALLPTPAPRAEIALGNWAMHPTHGKVLIVSTKPDDAGYVYVAYECPSVSNGASDSWAKAADLSPVPSATEQEGVNGPTPDPEGMTTQDPHTGEWEPYRHTPNTPEPQPRMLSTLSDYENAPTGTIVAQAGASPYVLTRNGMWGNRHRHEMNHPQASERSRTVLRWGWGERA